MQKDILHTIMYPKANHYQIKEVLKAEDLFIEPYLDSYLVYAPLYGLTLICGPEVANLILLVRKQGETISHSRLNSLVQEVVSLGVNLVQLKQHKPCSPTSYQPNEVMLSLTSACSLRCSYCYIKGGDSDRKLPWEIAKTAIDYVYSTAISLHRDGFSLSFHGEGEPSCNWPLLERCVLYAEEKAKKAGLNLKVYMATNCILNESQIEFIKKHFHSISASFDILEDVQNAQRPFKDGSGSFKTVLNTLRSFDHGNFPYGLRVTVTRLNVYRQEESIDFIVGNLSTRHVQLDPVCSYGRSAETGIKEVDPAIFIQQYRKTRIAAARSGIRLSYSGCRSDSITCAFCGAQGGNFAVSTEGWVSTCFEVLSPHDPRSRFLIIGRYDKDTHKFIIDEKKIAALLTRTSDTIKGCSKCFAKWNCGGECVAKILHHTPNDMNAVEGSARCLINRELLKDELVANTLKDTVKYLA